MSKDVWFWLFFVLGVLGWGYGAWRPDVPWGRGWPLFFLICLGILGWATFGGPVK